MVAANRFTTWYTKEAIPVVGDSAFTGYSLAQEGLYFTRYFAVPSYFRPIFSAGSSRSVSLSEFESSIEQPLFAMLIRSRSRAGLTNFFGRFPFDQIFRFEIPGIPCDEWNSNFPVRPINQSQAIGFQVSRENTRSNGGLFHLCLLVLGLLDDTEVKINDVLGEGDNIPFIVRS